TTTTRHRPTIALVLLLKVPSFRRKLCRRGYRRAKWPRRVRQFIRLQHDRHGRRLELDPPRAGYVTSVGPRSFLQTSSYVHLVVTTDRYRRVYQVAHRPRGGVGYWKNVEDIE